MIAPVILPHAEGGEFRQYRLNPRLTPGEIIAAIGFRPNVKDDPAKVKHSWGFTVDGERCGIWDYYGSRWSAWGSKEALERVFGEGSVVEE